MAHPIIAEAVIERTRQFLNTFLGVQESLFLGIGNKSYFSEHRRHGRGAQHEKTGLMHPFVAPSLIAVGCLHVARILYTLFHVAILHKFKDNIAL